MFTTRWTMPGGPHTAYLRKFGTGKKKGIFLE